MRFSKSTPDSTAPKHLVARTEHAVEQAEFLVEQLIDSLIGSVRLVQKIHHDHVELLPVAMAAADALLDTLRIPRQVIVHDQIAKLQIDAFGGGFRRDQDRSLIAEVIDQSGAQIGARRTGNAIRPSVHLQPSLINRL